MSHFTTIKTTFVSKEHLIEALQDVAEEFGLGNIREARAVRRGIGSVTTADLVVSTRMRAYDIGFVREEKAYNLIADWHGIKDINREHFTSRLTQRYAYHAVKESLEAKGFALVDEETDEKRTIHLRMRRVI
jgi:hypothetical protein